MTGSVVTERNVQLKKKTPVDYKPVFDADAQKSVDKHTGIGLSITTFGVAINAFAHAAAYAPSALCILGALWGGAWTWLTFVVGWVVVPIFDLLIGADTVNLSPEKEEIFRQSIAFRVVTWLHWPIQVATVTFSLYWITAEERTWVEWLGLLFSVGTAEGFGIGCVHELIHRPQSIDFYSGVLSLIWSTYGHFWVEHLWGHHRNVATHLDPASSDVGDISWTFVPRSLVLGFLESLEIEARILKAKGHWFISPFNRILQAYVGTALVAYGYYSLFGPKCLSFFFLQGFIAAWIVENTNFIEHYGLRRKEEAPGQFERVGWFHAWDTPELLTNTLLFKIQRHPDHHTNASRPYQVLRTYKEAPTLPTGYAGMIALSWFPPLFSAVMDWRVEIIKDRANEYYYTGKVLGEQHYPFPSGARAVASRWVEDDARVLPASHVEKGSDAALVQEEELLLKRSH